MSGENKVCLFNYFVSEPVRDNQILLYILSLIILFLTTK